MTWRTMKAKGNAPATGMPRTPAPDEITNVRAPTAAGYGQNGPTNNSPSVPPGKRVVSPLGLSMEGDIVDPVKSEIISGGTEACADWQDARHSSRRGPPMGCEAAPVSKWTNSHGAAERHDAYPP